jgi:carbamoyltransferase
MKILGLSFFYHDAAAALLIDGTPVAMAQEERFSRKKNDSKFPSLAINFVLEEAGIKVGDIDYVVFYEKPFFKFDRIFKGLLATFPSNPKIFIEALKHLFLNKLWIRLLITKELKIDPRKILFSEHHLSHAASAFLCSPYDEAAILTVDGVGEWTTTTIGFGNGNKIKILKEIHFPHSLGLLYSAFTAFLGFEVNEGEYKVMGMAPYGKPKYADKVKKMIRFFDDGSYELDMNYFSFHHSLNKTYSNKFVELFGKPRDPKSKFFTRETGWPSYFGPKPVGQEYEKLAVEQEHYADVATSIQAVTEEALIKLAMEAHKLTGAKKLCIAGGVGLNSVANWKILNNTPFEKIFVQPAAGDAGGALGAALATYHIALNNKRNFVMDHAYYGKSYTNEEIKEFINKNDLASLSRFIKDDDELMEVVVDNLIEGKVIGWFHGRFEWGPRALGSRSILADARRSDMKDILNTKIKFREPYRPFAPSALVEKAEEIFEISKVENHYPARFMLYVVDVKPTKRKLVPAITHVDGTARPQLVYQKQSPRYWKLINKFYQKTGVPMILNTSFNLKGEPIVNSPADALKAFSKSEMDLLVLENFIIRKS